MARNPHLRVDGPIGGFFELDLGIAPEEATKLKRFTSIARRWFGGAALTQDYRNARSALLGALQRARGVRTLWLPAYMCVQLGDVAKFAVSNTLASAFRYYPLAAQGPIAPDCKFLAKALRSGDAIVIVNHFGRPPTPQTLQLANARKDVLWIEDRVQALWPGRPWGDAMLYGARKLVGVPDGGFLVVPRAGRLSLEAVPAAEFELPPANLVLPSYWRFEDANILRNAVWYGAYRQAEDSMESGPHSASRLTRELLRRIDFTRTARIRRKNFAVLRALLANARKGPAVRLPPLAHWVPQGYPVAVADAAATGCLLAREGVFAPNLWADMPGAGECARTQNLANRVLLLPCDHRYDETDMKRVSRVFLGSIRSSHTRFAEV